MVRPVTVAETPELTARVVPTSAVSGVSLPLMVGGSGNVLLTTPLSVRFLSTVVGPKQVPLISSVSAATPVLRRRDLLRRLGWRLRLLDLDVPLRADPSDLRAVGDAGLSALDGDVEEPSAAKMAEALGEAGNLRQTRLRPAAPYPW